MEEDKPTEASPEQPPTIDLDTLEKVFARFFGKQHKRDLETLKVHAGLAEKDSWRRWWLALLVILGFAALAGFMIYKGMDDKLGYILGLAALIIRDTIGTPGKRPQLDPDE